MDPRRRPESLEPQELGFTPQPAVPWLAPMLLVRTGVRTVLAKVFGSYLDKRELQGALPARVHQHPGTGGELWLDYVADLGDGFDATYSVAYLLGRPELTLDGHQLPRGDVLVMGGDQVYPAASMEAYEDRCKGPYTAALPLPPPDRPQPQLYALPGNHDWYDGLTAFLRLFVGERADHIGGWCTEQSRSYFALRLPHDWWLFAVDMKFGAYLDDPQLVYFEQVAEQLGPQHRVILVFPEPSWVKGEADPKQYDPIDFFLRTIITPTGARVPLMIAGDTHHYARYQHPERQLITCGGGGAYLSATQHLPEQITVPPKGTLVRKASPKQEYERTARFPSEQRSRRLGWGVFGKLPARNLNFVWLLGGIQLLLMLAIVAAADRAPEAVERLQSIPLIIMIIVVVGLTVMFANFPTGGPKRRRHLVAGLAHGTAQLALGAAGAWLWSRLPFVDWPWPLPLLLAVVLYTPVIGLLAGQLFAGYLLVASWFKINVNELYAAQGLRDYKSFLRLRFGADGALTLYPVGIPRIARSWRADPGATRPDAAWIAPAEQLDPHLIEPPITIR